MILIAIPIEMCADVLGVSSKTYPDRSTPHPVNWLCHVAISFKVMIGNFNIYLYYLLFTLLYWLPIPISNYRKCSAKTQSLQWRTYIKTTGTFLSSSSRPIHDLNIVDSPPFPFHFSQVRGGTGLKLQQAPPIFSSLPTLGLVRSHCVPVSLTLGLRCTWRSPLVCKGLIMPNQFSCKICRVLRLKWWGGPSKKTTWGIIVR